MIMQKRKEFSKLIIITNFVIFALVLITGCVLAWNGRDTSLFCYAIPSTGGVVGASVIFYYRKAQVENAVKLQLYSLEEMYKLREKYPTQAPSVENAISSQEACVGNLVNTYSSDATTPVDIQG